MAPVAATAAHPPEHPAPGVRCGGDPPAAIQRAGVTRNCVPPELQRHVRSRIAVNRQRLGLTYSGEGALAGPASPPILYQFFPMAGNTDHGDIVNGQFVDLDPGAASLDFACRTFGGGGHAGVDCGILTFAHQSVGVPVFAATDGVVVFAQDGWPDMNLFGGVQGNIVAIDHGAGVESQYYHLKNGSVAVSVGQQVKAGQQIGKCASSGNSFGPHLHFQTMVNGQVYEPFAGACRPGPSGWSDQEPLDTDDLFLVDFGITKSDLNALPNPWWQPWEIPCDSQFSTGDASVNFYWEVYNFPAMCPFSVKFFKPDNSLAWDYTSFWGNPEFFRHQKSWFGFDFQAMGPVPGTWRLEFRLNDQLMIDAPFEVVSGPANTDFNRPPQPISVAFDPPAPLRDDVVFCRVNTTLAKEDLDWDIVRYRYVWKVNGVTVRDVINAAHSDAIERSIACVGATLTCTVTPNDGTVDGAVVQASVIVGGPHTADLNCDGAVNVTDLLTVISGWGPCPPPLPPPSSTPHANCEGDINNDGIVNVTDLLSVISNWS